MTPESNETPRTLPLNLVLSLAALVVIVAGLKIGASLLVPLLLALFITLICMGPVNWLHRLGMGRHLAILVTLVVLGGALVMLGVLLTGSFRMFVETLPNLESQLSRYYLDGLTWLARHDVIIEPMRFTEWIDPTRVTELIPAFLGQLGSLLVQSALVLLLVVFMLFEALSLRVKISMALEDPAPSLRRFQEFSLTLKRYLAVKTAISLVTGALVWLACVLVGVDFPLLWATLAFALNYIPNIGSALAAVPPVLLLLIMPEGGAFGAMVLAGAYLGINFVMGNLLEPRLMGRAMGLSTLVAFLSMVVWGWIFGTVGLLLSVPLTMTLKIALDSHPETRWIARLLGPGYIPGSSIAFWRRLRLRRHRS